MKKMLHSEIWAVVQTVSSGQRPSDQVSLGQTASDQADGFAVLLRPKNSDVAVPIFIGQLESHSILIGKEGVVLPRPLTHDLLLNLIDSQNLILERVEIHELIENTFHAQLVISGGIYTPENPLFLDSRPSDAFALSVRRKCPILVSSEIVKQTGIPLELVFDTSKNIETIFPSEETGPSKKDTARLEKIRMFQNLLNAAVVKEDYEKAAEIRDFIREMEDSDTEI